MTDQNSYNCIERISCLLLFLFATNFTGFVYFVQLKVSCDMILMHCFFPCTLAGIEKITLQLPFALAKKDRNDVSKKTFLFFKTLDLGWHPERFNRFMIFSKMQSRIHNYYILILVTLIDVYFKSANFSDLQYSCIARAFQPSWTIKAN